MTPRQTAQKLRQFLNDNGLTLSDLRKAQILILNGDMAGDLGDRKVKVEARKPVSSQPRKPNAERSVFKVLAGSAC